MCGWRLLLLWGLLPGAAAGGSGRTYPHRTLLDSDGKYWLGWGQRGSRLAFRLEVRTAGYVGLGFSPTGTMAAADIVVGGVAHGQPYLQDYFTSANKELKKDPQQDYHLEYAMENSTHTIIEFSRELHTCDTNDKSITDSTVRVIWAYHHEDVEGAGPKYHDSNRGTKSLRLLNPEKTSVLSTASPYFDLVNQDVPIPNKGTTYWCQMFKIPVFQEKHHIIKGDNLITECRYNTKDRVGMTWGGLSTRNEMCLSYLLYYPRINLTRCASIPDIMEQLQFIGVKEIYRPVTTWPFIIKSPKQYKNLSFMDAMNKFKWTKKEGLAFNKLVLSLPVNVRCSKTDNAEWSIQGMTALPPDIERPYKAEPLVCGTSSSSSLNKNVFLKLFLCFMSLSSTLGAKSL